MTIRIRARFDGSMLIPEQALDLPKDSVVEIEIVMPQQAADNPARAAVHKAAAAAERADKITRTLQRTDMPVQSTIAKRSSDEVSAPREK